jgi:hypothetical protein
MKILRNHENFRIVTKIYLGILSELEPELRCLTGWRHTKMDRLRNINDVVTFDYVAFGIDWLFDSFGRRPFGLEGIDPVSSKQTF